MATVPGNAVDFHSALLKEKRWDLINSLIPCIVALVGGLIGGMVSNLLTALSPLLGLLTAYVILRYRARVTSTPERLVTSLHFDRDRAPWTWVAIFALSTWGAAEVVSAIVGFSVGATTLHLAGAQQTDLVLSVLAAYEIEIAIISTLVACVVAVPAGRAIGLREAIHPYRWLAFAAAISRALAIASNMLYLAVYNAEFSPLPLILFHVAVGFLVFGAGALGVVRGRKGRAIYRGGVLLRALPAESRVAALELISEEARSVLSATGRGRDEPNTSSVVRGE